MNCNTLQQRPLVFEHIGAGARQLGGTLHIDEVELLAESQVVLERKTELRELSHLPHENIVLIGLTIRHVLCRNIRHQQHELVELLLERAELLLVALDTIGQLPHLADTRLLLFSSEGRDFLADLFLGSAKLFALKQQLLPLVIELENAIDRLIARGVLLPAGRLDQVGILSKSFYIEHGTQKFIDE